MKKTVILLLMAVTLTSCMEEQWEHNRKIREYEIKQLEVSIKAQELQIQQMEQSLKTNKEMDETLKRIDSILNKL